MKIETRVMLSQHQLLDHADHEQEEVPEVDNWRNKADFFCTLPNYAWFPYNRAKRTPRDPLELSEGYQTLKSSENRGGQGERSVSGLSTDGRQDYGRRHQHSNHLKNRSEKDPGTSLPSSSSPVHKILSSRQTVNLLTHFPIVRKDEQKGFDGGHCENSKGQKIQHVFTPRLISVHFQQS
ncbi:MAG: hypothetical protein V1716_02095 [Candidatus Uhrbacteria bacterium]